MQAIDITTFTGPPDTLCSNVERTHDLMGGGARRDPGAASVEATAAAIMEDSAPDPAGAEPAFVIGDRDEAAQIHLVALMWHGASCARSPVRSPRGGPPATSSARRFLSAARLLAGLDRPGCANRPARTEL